ncbi:hypothetical protein ACFVFQ_33285 [Streptomyces sp. NPDC057743]|uniref:hypothetical protein n=1 Tax=Streptomyces sp. NPDC057743 TaxID=3346236 RepID=UPI0036BA42EF
MTDFSALSAVIGAGLTPTMTFLYQRLERLLDRGAASEPDPEIPAELTGTLTLPLQVDVGQLAARRQELEQLRSELSVYHRGSARIDLTDAPLLQALGRLRGNLEEIYGQRLTFVGEERQESGPFVRQHTDRVAGQQTGMHADEITGEASVIQEIGTVEQGGVNIGMRARRIGDPRPS